MFFTNQAILTYAPESTYGTAPSTGYVPLMVLADPTWAPMEGDSLETPFVLPYWSGNRQRNIRLYQTFQFQLPFTGSGVAGTAPNFAGLFPACKVTETLVTSTSATYTSAASTASSVTLRWVLAGANGTTSIIHQMTGARGDWGLTANNNENMNIQFSFTGLYSVFTDGSALPATSYTNQSMPSPIGPSTTVTVNSVTCCLQSFDLNAGNEVVFQSRAGCTPQVLITDSKPSGSIQVEQKAIASQDFALLSTSGLTYPISIGHTLGGTGNSQAITVAAASFGRASYASGDDKLLLRTLPFNATGSSPWSLALT
jgi:hypothetical protein